MEKKPFKSPVVKKGQSHVYEVVCKKASCSGSSTHISTIYYEATTISTSKKTA